MGKGRNKELVEKRDEALLRRYYYWTEVERLRFDDTLKVLSENEFFLSQETILSIIRKKCNLFTEIKPAPKVKVPRVTASMLSLFKGE